MCTLQHLLALGLTLTAFYSDLRDILRKVNSYENIVLMGEFNARVKCYHAAGSSSVVKVQENITATLFSSCSSVRSSILL